MANPRIWALLVAVLVALSGCGSSDSSRLFSSGSGGSNGPGSDGGGATSASGGSGGGGHPGGSGGVSPSSGGAGGGGGAGAAPAGGTGDTGGTGGSTGAPDASSGGTGGAMADGSLGTGGTGGTGGSTAGTGGSSSASCTRDTDCAGTPGVCQRFACDLSNGVCVPVSVSDGGACDDGDACTRSDTCQGGQCVGAAPVVCTASDVCHSTGTCDPATGQCSDPVVADGTTCSDGLTCTSGDVCTNGTCAGTAVTCDDGIACTVDSCSESAGGCIADVTACSCDDSTQCDDHNACNGVETCNLSTHKCTSGASVDCSSLTDQCNTGTCNPSTGACSAAPRANGSTCDDGNACTQSDTCQSGACTGADPVICAAPDACHGAGTCDVQTGKCGAPALPDGTACNDGSPCTKTDTCQGGTCTGRDPVTCVAQDQCHSAGLCNPLDGFCTSPPKADGTACSDGNACTQTDTCQSGACTGASPVGCAAQDQCHVAGACDPASGVCSNPARPDGATCDDGDACTQSDACNSGICAGSNPVVCTAQDQCHIAGACDPKSGVCSNPARADGSSCDDGNPCTQTDSCVIGACKGANPVVCTAQDQCHVAGTCNPLDGLCTSPTKANGTACDDGNACTRTDTCQQGACAGANPVVCTAQDQCHSAGTCDTSSGSCTNPAKSDGTACNDGLVCTSADACTNGTCAGKAITCNDGIACTVDGCSEAAGGCTADVAACQCKQNADCDDGNACNGVETCDKTFTCKGGTPVDCSGLTNACNVGTCNPTNGACTAVASPNGTACSDGNACTQTDTCQGGACTGSNPVACTAQDQCHVAGTCNSANGTCSNPAKPDATACDDGNACTQTDTCQGGACTGSNPVACTAQDQCHVAGTCDSVNGTCSNPVKPNGAPCSDSDACTKTDTCQGGACTGANPVTCTAADQCHVAGTCSPANGQCSNPNKADDTACNDGSACTKTDTCQAGVCLGGNPVVCTAQDGCHDAGTCDPSSGSCSSPVKADGTVCDDGNACSKTDSCQSGACKGTNLVVCSAVDQCHVAGTCVSATGLCTTPARSDGTACNDGNACTPTESCQSGVCTGTDVCSVTIAPTAVSISPNGTYAFTASVSGTTNQSVTWSVQEGMPAGGVVDSGGNYTAPSATSTYHVVATSVADPAKSATATVTVTNTPVAVSLCPQTTTLLTDDTMKYTAFVAGTANQAVTWSVSGGSGGTIDAAGLFTPGAAGTYTIKAVSLAEPVKQATATATVVVQTLPSLSGTVTYAGAATGPIYVIPQSFGVGATVLTTPGAYRIRNVQTFSGTFDVMAYRDTLGIGTYVSGVDPVGKTTVNWTGTDPGNADITLTDPTPPALVAPKTLYVATGDGLLLGSPERIVDANNDELPDHYRVWVGLDAGVGPTSHVMVRDYRAGGPNVALLAPLTNGTAYWVAGAGVRGGVVGPMTVSGPYTVGPHTAGPSVSGTIDFTGLVATGPLYVMVLPNQGPPSIARYTPGPAATSQPYTIQGVPDGIYKIVALFDQNDDGEIASNEPGDFRTNSAPVVVVQGSDVTGLNAVIPKTAGAAWLTTRHDWTSSFDSYGLRFSVGPNTKLTTKVALTSGPGLSAPTDFPTADTRGNTGEYTWESPKGPAVPTLGATYTFDVTFDDGVTCSMTATVGAVLAGVPKTVSPTGTGTATPTFVWLGPSPAPASFLYQLEVWPAVSSSGSTWLYSMAPPQTSVVFDVDLGASSSTLSSGVTYNWAISTIDPAGNEARSFTTFSVP